MAFLSVHRSPRARRGQLLVEALVALVLAAATLLALAFVAEGALAMGDAALQFDRAAQSVESGGAVALRASCGLGAWRWDAPWSARHQSTRTSTPGDVAALEVVDRWRSIGVARHDSLAVTARIGVRCD